MTSSLPPVPEAVQDAMEALETLFFCWAFRTARGAKAWAEREAAINARTALEAAIQQALGESRRWFDLANARAEKAEAALASIASHELVKPGTPGTLQKPIDGYHELQTIARAVLAASRAGGTHE